MTTIQATGWTRGLDLRDHYGLLMSIAADAENRADKLESAVVTVEAELGQDALSSDAGIRAASHADQLRVYSRNLRDEATAAFRRAAEVQP